jgi:hypothetical protein
VARVDGGCNTATVVVRRERTKKRERRARQSEGGRNGERGGERAALGRGRRARGGAGRARVPRGSRFLVLVGRAHEGGGEETGRGRQVGPTGEV